MAAPALRAEDFVVDPAKERIVTFDALPGERTEPYLARRLRNGGPRINGLQVGMVGGVRAGTVGGIYLPPGMVDRLPIPPGIVVTARRAVMCEVEFTGDQKVYFADNNRNDMMRSVYVEPTQTFVVHIQPVFIGYIQRMPEGMKQLYRGLPGLPSEVMNEIAGFAVSVPPHYFSGAEARDGTVLQPAYVNSNAGRRAAMIEKHEGAAAAASGGAGGGAAAPAPTKNRRSRTHRATRRRNRSSKSRKQ
jgi:hypothetical protein